MLASPAYLLQPAKNNESSHIGERTLSNHNDHSNLFTEPDTHTHVITLTRRLKNNPRPSSRLQLWFILQHQTHVVTPVLMFSFRIHRCWCCPVMDQGPGVLQKPASDWIKTQRPLDHQDSGSDGIIRVSQKENRSICLFNVSALTFHR